MPVAGSGPPPTCWFLALVIQGERFWEYGLNISHLCEIKFHYLNTHLQSPSQARPSAHLVPKDYVVHMGSSIFQANVTARILSSVYLRRQA